MTQRARTYRRVTLLALTSALVVLAGCRQDMHDQPKYQPLEASAFFDDGRASRHAPKGTVARGQLRDDVHLYTGITETGLADTFPMAITPEVMARGQERYNIYCSPCHARTGMGNGMIVQRGYRQPSSFHIERLRDIPHGYFFNVMSNGFGVMPSYAAQVPVEDRWAIIAYIRALQRSQNARMSDVPQAVRPQLMSPMGSAAAPRTGEQ